MKHCKQCDTTKPKSEFHKEARRKDGLNTYCRQCRSQTAKEWYEKNKEQAKKTAIAWQEKNPDYKKEWRKNNPDKVKGYEERKKLRRYGVTIEQYNNLLDQQNNRCAICKEEEENGRPFHIDHDHSCCPGKNSCGECVRKLLCYACNWGLGFFKDNPVFLRGAAEYVEDHRTHGPGLTSE